jgi:3-hydroxyacyl-[acyl-carrier-protein] dehydratase
MPPQFLFDVAGIDWDRIVFDQEAIRAVNPQRGDMEMLNAVTHADPGKGEAIGYKDVLEKEFWVPGHIPGRPLFPGVLMIETAAQLASFYTKQFLKLEGFIGFGAVDGVKFRGQVVPGDRFYIVLHYKWHRHRRIHCACQGWVKGNLVFEAEVTGVQL